MRFDDLFGSLARPNPEEGRREAEVPPVHAGNQLGVI